MIRDDEEPERRLLIDVHEPPEIARELRKREVPFVERKLSPGDFVVGHVGVERKTIYDFWASLTRQRLFDQLARLREAYAVPLLVVEGPPSAIDEFSNPRVLHGAMAAIALDARIPILWTGGHAGTADLLTVLHRREATAGRFSRARTVPRSVSPRQAQRLLVQGLPSVGEVTADRLLSHFGSARAVFAASPRDLARVPRLGEQQAAAIARLLDEPYPSRDGRIA
ncbi:MAG TPA: ERCC4 domain-containing protein [Candidatus Thermoplasmatota archaeon]|nr:ERCC4 domain-containing protein [Candidatus Thermoplasmatota archaeon]